MEKQTIETYFDWLKRKTDDIASQQEHKLADCLRLAPDFFLLLVKILNDENASGALKTKTLRILNYFLLPTDLLPEAFLGVHGLHDDLFLVGLFLRSLQADGYTEYLQSIWIGPMRLEDCLQRVLDCETELVDDKVAVALREAVRTRL